MYLNCHSFHSLRYGTIPLTDLVEQGAAYKVKAIALTDINTVTGIYDFYKACKAADIKPLVGIEFRQDNKLLYIGLAKNREGIGEMCRFLTWHNFEDVALPEQAPDFANVTIIYPVENLPTTLKDYEHIGIRPEQVTLLFSKQWHDKIDKMVVLQPVTYRTKKEYNLHKILRAIDLNVIGSKLVKDDYCTETEVLRPLHELEKCYAEYPQILRNTERLIGACNFEYEFGIPRNKQDFTGSKESDKELLYKLAYEGLAQRYPQDNGAARARVERELKVIHDLNFSGYFLITWDIVNYSFNKGLMHIGRGSGANSIVAYCLGITDICPLELDLYFERFLNLNRKSPPDFDIDWSWQDRDTILEYIFERYGRDHVAFCGTIAEFKDRSILREIGKVFGLPKEELDALVNNRKYNYEKNDVIKMVCDYGEMIRKYPNMRSMHSCGILISEEPITNYTALEMPPKGFPIVQFDMHIAEDIGFDKFDILSQRGIGHINDAAALVYKNTGVKVDIRNTAMSKDNPACNEFLSRGANNWMLLH